MKIAKLAILPLTLLLLSGCSPQAQTPEAGEAPDAAASASASPSARIPYIKGTGVSLLNQTVTAPSGESISLIPSNKYPLTLISVWSPSIFNGSNSQLKELIKLHQAYGPRGLRIIVAAYETPSKEITEAIKNMQIPFEMGTGNHTLFDALQMKSIPTTWYLDSAGAVVKTVEGFEAVEEMSADIEELVKSLASSEPVSDASR